MSVRAKPPRWQRRSEDRPQELLDAALAAFVEKGYMATRLEDISQRAGVAKATLYRYYENKLDLFKAVVSNSLVAGFDEIAQAQAGKPLSAKERLTGLLTAFMARVTDSPLSGIPKLIIAEAGNQPEVARFYYDEVVRRGQALVTATLKQGIATGEFRALDTEYAWRIVIAPLLLAIIWKHSFQAFDAEPLDSRRHLESHLELLFNGIADGRKKN
jgi:AcrR family transcriptional regulator